MENRIKKLSFVLVMLAGFSSYAVSNTVEDYKKACMKQDAQGCLNLGLAYAKGIETERDYESAKNFLDIACDLGNTQACAELKDIDQHRNDSTETEEDNSLDKFIKDASRDCNRGDSSECLIIGTTCEDLSEDKCNSAIAAEYYKKACDLGDSLACSSLGSLYNEGKGVERNYAKKVEYKKRACDLGRYTGCWSLGLSYEEGKGVERNYAKAKEYYQKACDLGDAAGYCAIGHLYKEGKGVERNYAKAKEYYQKACDLGDASGCVFAEMIDAIIKQDIM